jgi:hypothetical protein
MDVSIQMFRIMNADIGVLPDAINVFPRQQPPQRVCFIKLAPWAEIRNTMRVWEAQDSGIAGCTSLVRPVRAERRGADLNYLSDTVSLVQLLEELYSKGWHIQDDWHALLMNATPDPTVFSKAKLGQRCKAYFQCLYCLPALFARGLLAFHHTCAARYYMAILRSPNPHAIPVNASMAEYTALLEFLNPPDDAALDPGAYPVAGGESPVSESEAEQDLIDAVRPRKRRRRGPGSTLGSACGSDEEVGSLLGSDGDAPGSPVPVDPPTPDVAHDPSDSPIGSDAGQNDPLPPLFFPLRFEGTNYSLQTTYDKDGIAVVCRSGHQKCRKWRGLQESQTARYGRWEAVAYCTAWLRLGAACACQQEHRFAPITPRDVERAYEDLVDAFGIDS